MRRLLPLLAALPLFLAAGCISRQAEQDIADSAAAIDSANSSLPDSPQKTAIRANAQAIIKALGKDLP